MTNRLVLLLPSALLTVFVAGCGNGSALSSATTSPTAYPTVAGDVTKTSSAAVSGQHYLLCNLQGYDVSAVPVSVLSSDMGDSDHSVYYQINNQPVGEGFSGSPDTVGTPSSASNLTTVDALYAGYNGTSNQYVARPIAEMLSLSATMQRVSQPSGSSVAFIATGISNDSLKSLSAHMTKNGANPLSFTANSTSKATALRSTLSQAVPPARAGSTVGVCLVWGDLVTLSAYGADTVNTSSNTSVVFGHPFEYVGSDTAYPWPAWVFKVDGIVTSASDTFKLAHPEGSFTGAFVQDRAHGCVITWDTSTVKTIPMQTVISSASSSRTYNHTCADLGSAQNADEQYGLTAVNGTCLNDFRNMQGKGSCMLTIKVQTDAGSMALNPGALSTSDATSSGDLGLDIDFAVYLALYNAVLPSNHVTSISVSIALS